jgi:hypothetical protein
MSDKYIINGVEGRWACDEPSPNNYAIEGDLQPRRITMYKNERVVLFMEYVVQNSTRYVLYFEVAEFFRGKRWLNYIKDLRLEEISSQHPGLQFLQPKVVYLKVSPWLAKTMPDILATREETQAVEKTIMKQLYIQGSYNDALE